MIDKDKVLAEWDFTDVKSPAYVINQDLLEYNLSVIDKVRDGAGVDVIVALKANATWNIFPQLQRHSDGATASSLAEARLVFEEYGELAHTYAPVYSESEFSEIMSYSSHITFNSLNQFEKYGADARAKGISCGLRVNPEFSTVDTELYDPCDRGSRLGILSENLTELPLGVDGLHFHSLCESLPADLKATLEAIEERFGGLLSQIKWINMGGGHLMTHKDYDEDELILILKSFKSRYPHLKVILEPGSAFTWDTGCLVSTVEDIVCNGGVNTALLNVSFACHMPDCLEMPYKPTVLGASEPKDGETKWRLGGNSCLAGDFCGDWSFDSELRVGDKVVFRDMIHYTMVKTTMFNGVSHPSIVKWSRESGFEVIKEFGYDDYKGRMS